MSLIRPTYVRFETHSGVEDKIPKSPQKIGGDQPEHDVSRRRSLREQAEFASEEISEHFESNEASHNSDRFGVSDKRQAAIWSTRIRFTLSPPSDNQKVKRPSSFVSLLLTQCLSLVTLDP